MATSPFKDYSVAKGDSGSLPTSVNIAPSAADGDLIVISATTRALALGATRPISNVTGFTEVGNNTPPINNSNVYTSVQYKIASGEGASYSFTLNAAVTDAIVVCSAWDTTLLSGSVGSLVLADGGQTNDGSADFTAGLLGAANSTTDAWGVFFHSNQTFSSGGGSLVIPSGNTGAVSRAIETLDAHVDIGAGGYLFHNIIDEFRSDAWPAGPGPVPDCWSWPNSPNPFNVVFVWGLWLPGYTAAATAFPRWGWYRH